MNDMTTIVLNNWLSFIQFVHANAATISITFSNTQMSGELFHHGYDFFLEEHIRRNLSPPTKSMPSSSFLTMTFIGIFRFPSSMQEESDDDADKAWEQTSSSSSLFWLAADAAAFADLTAIDDAADEAWEESSSSLQEGYLLVADLAEDAAVIEGE